MSSNCCSTIFIQLLPPYPMTEALKRSISLKVVGTFISLPQGVGAGGFTRDPCWATNKGKPPGKILTFRGPIVAHAFTWRPNSYGQTTSFEHAPRVGSAIRRNFGRNFAQLGCKTARDFYNCPSSSRTKSLAPNNNLGQCVAKRSRASNFCINQASWYAGRPNFPQCTRGKPEEEQLLPSGMRTLSDL